MTGGKEKPWGGRFREATDKDVESFTASIAFDRRLFRHDIDGSMAHARMLCRQGILTEQEEKAILGGLKKIRSEMEAGSFHFRAEDEDIHMAVEKALIEKIGPPGEKLHTGRSRNDQIALDIRLYLRDEIREQLRLLDGLRESLLALANQEREDDHARLYPSAEGPARASGAIFPGLRSDVRAGCGAPPRLPEARERDAPRSGGPGRDGHSPGPGLCGETAQVSVHYGKQHGYRIGPGFCR